MKKIVKLTESDLTNIVKRIIRENTAKDSLIDMIKNDGWGYAADLVGGDKNLKKLSGIVEPIDYLNFFNNLNVDMNDDNTRGILTNNEGDRVISISTSKNNKVFSVKEMMFGFRDEFNYFDTNEKRGILSIMMKKIF